MANSQNTLIEPDGKAGFLELLAAAVARASEAMERGDVDPVCHYPVLWLYVATTGKDWKQVRDDAAERFSRSRSLTTREIDCFLATTDNDLKLRAVYEFFSKHLWCKWMQFGSPRRHKWSSLELSLVCPDNDEAIRKVDFEEELYDEIAYLDPGGN